MGGCGRDSPGGGWGAGAKPRLCTCREFQYKIGKVRKTHEVPLREIHGSGGMSPGPWLPYFDLKFLTCPKVYSVIKFIKSGEEVILFLNWATMGRTHLPPLALLFYTKIPRMCESIYSVLKFIKFHGLLFWFEIHMTG